MSAETRIGKYEILDELGRGGFGIVYKARDTVLGRLLALKVLHNQLTVDPGFIGRFQQEAKLAAQLDHPNLVPVFDLGQAEGNYFIAMGYMSGGSLKDKLKTDEQYSQEESIQLITQILYGTRFIHENGVIHRDLKPGNILFDQHGTARISDLGFAKALRSDSSLSLSMSGGMIGTPAYMAPEIWRGKPASVQSDIYSLGCIIFEILTGRSLFDGETPAESMTKHLIDGPVFDEDFDQTWKVILTTALARSPEDRSLSIQGITSALRTKQTAVSSEAVTSDSKPVRQKVEALTPEPATLTELETEFLVEEQANLPSTSDPGAGEASLELDQEFLREVITVSGPDYVVGRPMEQNHSTLPPKKTEAVPEIPVVMEQELTTEFVEIPETDLESQAEAVITPFSEVSDLQLSSEAESHAPPQEPLAEEPDEVAPTRLVGPTHVIGRSVDRYFGQIGADVSDMADSFLVKSAKNRSEASPINSVSWNLEGKILAYTSKKEFSLWDGETNKSQLPNFAGVHNINFMRWSPFENTITVATTKNLYLYDLSSNRITTPFTGITDGILCFDWSKDGSLFATAAEDGSIRIWDQASHELKLTFRTSRDSLINIHKLSGISWSPDGSMLAASNFDLNKILLFNVAQGVFWAMLDGTGRWSTGVKFSPDGRFIASGNWGYGIDVWHSDSWEKHLTLQGHSDAVRCLAWLPDSKQLLSGSNDSTIRIWDIETGKTEQILKGHNASVLSLDYAVQTRTVAAGFSDGSIRQWIL